MRDAFTNPSLEVEAQLFTFSREISKPCVFVENSQSTKTDSVWQEKRAKMAVWRSYFCYNCKIRKNPGDPESTLETCGDCQLVKFCSDDCKAKALPFHGDECEIRRKDLEQLQTLTAKAKPGVWAFLDQDQMDLVDEYHSLVLELGEETFQRAANTGDFFLHEVALGFSNQIMTFDVVATRRQSRHLYMLILLERIEEMMDFLNKLPETWFGKYDTLGKFLCEVLVPVRSSNAYVESLQLLNYKTIFLEAEKQIEARHLLDVIFNIPKNLCLWTLSNLTKSQADDIGFLGDKIRKMLPKEL